MENNPSRNLFFPQASQVLIVGGEFRTIYNRTQIQHAPKSGYERLLEVTSPNALYNSGHDFDAPKCHLGTRVAVIQAIINWMSGLNNHPRKKDIAWLTGAAGAGKSAIGRSVCERCSKEGKLLAAFFFGANDGTRNHSHSLVATIVYQVGLLIPPVRQAITKIIDNDPLILTRSLREQLATLLIIPLSSTVTYKPGMAPRLIVIDGLDECLSHSSQLEILDAILYVLNISPLPIRFLICSHPENHIVNFFSTPQVQERLFKIFLGDEYSPDHDIALYLTDSFKAIKEGHIFKSLIPDSWPSRTNVDKLVENASGQFIYAATVVLYVASPHHRPDQRLESVLGLRAPFKDLPFAQLDALYLHILGMMENPQLAIDIMTLPVMFTGVVGIYKAARVLSLEPGDVEVILSDCASIVQIEGPPWRKIHLLHKSYLHTLAKCIRMVMMIYSEEHIGCRFATYEDHLDLNQLNLKDISHENWSSLEYQETLDAIIQFPMESFCEALFSHKRGCIEADFPKHFFEMLSQFKGNKAINDAYHHQIKVFCKCIVNEISINFHDDWEVNYILAASHLNVQNRSLAGDLEHNLQAALCYLSKNWSSNPGIYHQVGLVFRQILTKSEKARIFARSAVYVMEKLTDRRPFMKEESDRLLRIRRINQRIQRFRPWKWSRTFRLRVRADQLVWTHLVGKERYTLSNFETLLRMEEKDKEAPFWVCSITSVDWINVQSMNNTRQHGALYEYMSWLEYVIKILPKAEPYTPLIDLCKNKVFSPMSMAFPDLSRRARSTIADYLERVQ